FQRLHPIGRERGERRPQLPGIRRGQDSPGGEEISLDAFEQGRFPARGLQGDREPHGGVQGVDVTIGGDPKVVLRHPTAPEEARISLVSGLRVNLHVAEPIRPRLLARPLFHYRWALCKTWSTSRSSAPAPPACSARFTPACA